MKRSGELGLPETHPQIISDENLCEGIIKSHEYGKRKLDLKRIIGPTSAAAPDTHGLTGTLMSEVDQRKIICMADIGIHW